MAPVANCLRRAASEAGILTLRRHEIRWQDRLVGATAIEFGLLASLVERLGELVSHAEPAGRRLARVRDPDPLWLKPHLGRLREKLNALGARCRSPCAASVTVAGPAGPLTQVVSPVVSTASACMRRAAGTDSSR